MARTLKVDPAAVMTETDPYLNTVREAAARVAWADDKRAADKMQAQRRR